MTNNLLTKTIELNQIDTRYRDYRLQDSKRQKELLWSIKEQGILNPLEGVFKGDSFVLLNGFKRLLCVQTLKIGLVPVVEIADDEVDAILKLLQMSLQSLHILEEAKLVQELHSVYKLTIREIAGKLHKSSAWVSIRFTFLKETTGYTQEQVFNGRFPASSAAYTLRQFRRLNKVSSIEIDNFVKSVSGKKISTRDIDRLADVYFKGGPETKKQIEEQNFSWILNQIPSVSDKSLSEDERQILISLGICQKHIGKLVFKIPLLKALSKSYLAESKLLSEGLIDKIPKLVAILDSFGATK